ncbi:MAG TPA: hypothetical protein VG778_02975, partial [Blastocatellia bacterium]|nr:hypothetical protein [Blastocatellia bacterium]
MTIDKHQPRALPAAALGILLITGLIIVFNGGISIGLSNHAGLLPVVRRILDPNYLPGDFGISLRFYHHRVFAYVVAGFSALMGEDNGLIALSVIATLLLSGSLYILCRTLNLGTGGFIVAGLFLATRLAWTGLGLEENNFAGNPDVMPTTFSHAFILLATACCITGRYRLMGLFGGLAMLFHFQIGVVFAIVLLVLLATRVKELSRADALITALLFVLPALPAFLHFARMLQAGLANSSFTLGYINFRHPHHFRLFSTAAAIWLAVHVAVQIAASYWLKKRNKPEARAVGVLMTMSLTIAALSLLHFLDYYVLQIGFIAKLQLLRLSPLITVFGAISFVLALGTWEKEARLAGGNMLRPVYAGLLALVLAWSAYLF